MSCKVQWHSLQNYLIWALQVQLSMWAVCTFLLYSSLDWYWRINGRNLPPGWSTSRTSCSHPGESAVQGPTLQSGIYLCRVHELLKSTSWVCYLCRWLSGTSACSKAVLWVYWLWGLLGSVGQDQSSPLPCLQPPSMSYKSIFRWLLFVLSLEVARRDKAANQGWGHLASGRGHTEARSCLLESF